MGRKITMTGKNALYIEHRGVNATPDNDREIRMEGDEAVYQEYAYGQTGQHTCGVKKELPDCLLTEKAMKYWAKLQNEKFVDANYQLLPETTRKQAMYIAEAFAEKLGIQSKWKTFEQLWCISNLAQEKWDFQQTGTSPTRSKEIDKIFED